MDGQIPDENITKDEKTTEYGQTLQNNLSGYWVCPYSNIIYDNGK